MDDLGISVDIVKGNPHFIMQMISLQKMIISVLNPDNAQRRSFLGGNGRLFCGGKTMRPCIGESLSLSIMAVHVSVMSTASC